MPLHRKILSRVLNRFFAAGLGLPLRDLSSGFRLYRRGVLARLATQGHHFDVLEEILVNAYAQGWRVAELPFTYHPRQRGSSHARMIPFGIALVSTFYRLWLMRNSIESADYDERAFFSRIPLQRYWQRRRHRIITSFARGAGRTLDAGCGSSVILQSLNDAVGLDIRENKVRHMRQYGVPLVRGSVAALPFSDGSFDCVICSQVIEHIPESMTIFTELTRVLRPGGLLILGTPDYATIGWRIIEPLYGFFAPRAYAEEHIAHYTRARLEGIVAGLGCEVIRHAYVARSELIVTARKKTSGDVPAPVELAR